VLQGCAAVKQRADVHLEMGGRSVPGQRSHPVLDMVAGQVEAGDVRAGASEMRMWRLRDRRAGSRCWRSTGDGCLGAPAVSRGIEAASSSRRHGPRSARVSRVAQSALSAVQKATRPSGARSGALSQFRQGLGYGQLRGIAGVELDALDRVQERSAPVISAMLAIPGDLEDLIRKSVSYRAGGSARRSVSGAGLGVAGGSGGGFEGDFVAEGFELADVGLLAPVRVDAGVEVVAAEVGEAGAGFG
jgi:hypothetical protein